MQPRRILVCLPSWVGDAVMATPALRALRAAHPDSWIGAEGRPALAGLLAGLPSFDAFLPEASRGILGRFDASHECEKVTCIYHGVNWWLEKMIEDPREEPDFGAAVDRDDYFL